MMKKFLRVGLWFFGICAFSLMILGVFSCKQSGEASSTAYRFAVVIYDSPGNPFWAKVQNGVKEAEKFFNCSATVQYASGDPVKQNDILESALTNKVDGIAVTINYDDAYDQVVAKAREQGVPVVAFNMDDSSRSLGNARMAYIGQDMEEAGFNVANRLIAEAKLKAGDKVLCAVENPEAIYARQRYAGVTRALSAAGISSTLIKTGNTSLEDTLNRMTQHLLSHTDTNAVMGLGQMPLEMAPKAIEEAKLNIPNAGFDLSIPIAENIKAGKTIATVDQQPFYQGFYTIAMLYYNQKYGMLPCDINTGGGLVDKSSIDKVIQLADTIR